MVESGTPTGVELVFERWHIGLAEAAGLVGLILRCLVLHIITRRS